MKLTKETIIIGLGILSLCLGAAIGAYFAFAQSVPKLINYQGSLTDKDGNPITTQVSVRFSIYAQDAGGSPLWTETQIVTPQENGLFSVLLGSVELFPDNFFKENPNLYLGIAVEGDSEMMPRQQLSTVAYAFQAENANTLAGKGPEAFAPKDHQHPSYEIPSGMIVMFDRSCPSGWTRVDALDGRFPMGASSYGATGGASSHSHSVPNHTHTFSGRTTTDTSPKNEWINAPGHTLFVSLVDHYHDYSGTTSASGGGSTSDASNIPPYVTVVFCRKE